MYSVGSSSKGLSRTESDWTDVATKAIIVTIALAAITAFALCFVKSPYLPKNIFNNQLVWVYGSIGFLTTALLVYMANKGGGGSNFGVDGNESGDEDPANFKTPTNFGPRKSFGFGLPPVPPEDKPDIQEADAQSDTE